MEIVLRERTEEHVRIWFARSGEAHMLAGLPRSAQTLEQALEEYRRSLQPGSTSFGRTVYADGRYVGDVWCYCIGEDDTPDAMLSYGIFEQQLWGCGIATEAVRLFLQEVKPRFSLKTVGAFTFADNKASIRVLEKNGFSLQEQFTEDGRLSCYLELEEK